MDTSISQFLLESKREDIAEYIVTLFEYCNVGCSFCYLDINNKIGLDTIREKIPVLLELLSREMKDTIVINTITGEPFAEEIFTEELRNDYEYFCKEVHEFCIKNNKYYRVNFITNLMMDDIEPMYSMLVDFRSKGYNIVISTSYDPKGRFNKKTKANWIKNIKELRNRNEDFGISICYTKGFIKELLNGDEIFDWLYKEDYDNFIDYYIPDPGPSNTKNAIPLVNANVPSELEMLKGFIYLIDHYPNIPPVSGFINGIKGKDRKLTCMSSTIITSSGEVVKCGGLHSVSPVIGFFEPRPKIRDNEPIESSFMKERNCIGCDHFDYCKMGCFMTHAFKKKGHLKECLYKLTYNYIIDRKPIDYNTIETYFGVGNIK